MAMTDTLKTANEISTIEPKLNRLVNKVPEVGVIRPIGRPTKFSKEVSQRVYEFVAICVEKRTIPTIEGLAGELGVVMDTLLEWRNPKYTRLKKARVDFSSAIKHLKQKQAEMLQAHGLSGRYNNAMAIFLLKNNHGFKDKHEVDHTSEGRRIESIDYIIPENKPNKEIRPTDPPDPTDPTDPESVDNNDN